MRPERGKTPGFTTAWATELREAGLTALRPGWPGDVRGPIPFDAMRAEVSKNETPQEHLYEGPAMFYWRTLPEAVRAQIPIVCALTGCDGKTSWAVPWMPAWFAFAAVAAWQDKIQPRRFGSLVDFALGSPDRGASVEQMLESAWRLGGADGVVSVIRSLSKPV